MTRTEIHRQGSRRFSHRSREICISQSEAGVKRQRLIISCLIKKTIIHLEAKRRSWRGWWWQGRWWGKRRPVRSRPARKSFRSLLHIRATAQTLFSIDYNGDELMSQTQTLRMNILNESNAAALDDDQLEKALQHNRESLEDS